MVMPEIKLPSISPLHVGLHQASVFRGNQKVLDDVTVTFEKAEITVILGSNGAGKSTLLSALAGLIPLTSGQQHRCEQDGRMAPITRIGYILQKPVLFRRSVLDNIHIAMKAAGFEPRDHSQDRDAVLSMLAIDHVINKPAFRLSQGERQRLAVARVLLMQPGFMMLDEATNSLDQESVDILENQIRLYVGQGMPALWVTHNLTQAERLADRVMTIDRGRIRDDVRASEYFA
jgi:ABC-type multidrug transport system ATPase subunit